MVSVPDLPLCLSTGPRWPGMVHPPAKKNILRWIFAYVVQFDAVYMSDLI